MKLNVERAPLFIVRHLSLGLHILVRLHRLHPVRRKDLVAFAELFSRDQHVLIPGTPIIRFPVQIPADKPFYDHGSDPLFCKLTVKTQELLRLSALDHDLADHLTLQDLDLLCRHCLKSRTGINRLIYHRKHLMLLAQSEKLHPFLFADLLLPVRLLTIQETAYRFQHSLVSCIHFHMYPSFLSLKLSSGNIFMHEFEHCCPQWYSILVLVFFSSLFCQIFPVSPENLFSILKALSSIFYRLILAPKKENRLIPEYERILLFSVIFCCTAFCCRNYRIPLSFAFCTAWIRVVTPSFLYIL